MGRLTFQAMTQQWQQHENDTSVTSREKQLIIQTFSILFYSEQVVYVIYATATTQWKRCFRRISKHPTLAECNKAVEYTEVCSLSSKLVH